MLDFPRWKIVAICLTCVMGILAALPNFFSEEQLESWPSFLPTRQVTLGLDLQGGAHLLMEVDLKDVLKASMVDKRKTIGKALKAEDIGYRSRLNGDRIVVRLTKLSDKDRAMDVIEETAEKVGGSITSTGSDDILVNDIGGNNIEVTLSETAIKIKQRRAVAQSIEIVRRRIDEMGTKEPTVQQSGENRVLAQVPGIDDPQELKRILGQTAKMSFRLVNSSVSLDDLKRGRAPQGTTILDSVEAESEGGFPEKYAVENDVILSGENLVDASLGYDENNQPAVNFRFDKTGGKRFANATRKNVGRIFAIILDNKVISAPRIKSPILGGSGIITGSFTIESASELALLLRAGALPAPLSFEEERTVGPDLGADSVAAGKIAAILGLVAVMVYVVLSYGAFGMVTNVALVINVFLIFGALSTLNATLTLPGIAGIVLTIGMAVDANVLIFERIREELRAGKNALTAIEVGYARALSTIFDANVTTLIAAAILFQFGSGPVKGFAVTLGCGIITSVFTAVSVTRLIIATWARKRRPKTLKI